MKSRTSENKDFNRSIFQLSSTAMIVLVASNPDPVYSIFLVDKETAKKMEDIPLVFCLALIGVLVHFTLTSILGIWGYARLSRYLLTYYSCTLILSLIWATYLFCNIYYEEIEDELKVNEFLDYKYDKKARTLISIFQKHYKCCGIDKYRFEDVIPMPRSCCPNVPQGEICQKENAYEKRCPTKRMTLYQSLKMSNVLSYIPSVILIFGTLTLLEASLSFNMVYQLTHEHSEY